MKWSQSGMNWLKWPFFMGTHGKTILWMKCLLFTPPVLTSAGHKNRQALHRKGFGPKMRKKNLYPAKPALPKPRLRLHPAGIRTGRHPGLDQALPRWFRTRDYLGMRIASKKCGLNGFHTLSLSIYIIFTLWWSYSQILPWRRHAKVFIFIYAYRQHQDEYVLHM